ncbi:protein FAR1-RELATED SEQUENCE 5-like [Carex rostrata]
MSLGSSNISVDEDDYAPKIQLRLDVTDPYIHVTEELPTEEEDDVLDIASKPCVGMEFSTSEKAYTFYNEYACRVGFSVRKATHAKNRHGVSSIRFVCSKEGLSRWHKEKAIPIGSSTNIATPKKEHGVTRIGCKASCRIKLVKSGI